MHVRSYRFLVASFCTYRKETKGMVKIISDSTCDLSKELIEK